MLICKGSVPSEGREGFLYASSCIHLSSVPFFVYYRPLSPPLSSRPPCLPLSPLFLITFPLQGVVAAEKIRGGQLLEEPKMLPFRANTFSLQVSIQDVPQFLWSIKPFTTCQVTAAVNWQDIVSKHGLDPKVLICTSLFLLLIITVVFPHLSIKQRVESCEVFFCSSQWFSSRH